jgi:lipoprotein-releasing system ATP-binding protein
MNEPVLSIEGLRRVYKSENGPLEVLRGIDLEVEAGEVVGLLGASGTGKSTLLHAAGLLDRPTAGTIRIDGHNCGVMNEAARTRMRQTAIGFVYQFHHLLPEFSALENVAMPAMIAGKTRRQAQETAANLLSHMGLAARLSHQPSQLSGGEQQRVAVARALTNQPRLLLADEPTGNLDPANADLVFRTLRELVHLTGVGAVIATHNLDMARHMDRVLILLKTGSPVTVRI